MVIAPVVRAMWSSGGGGGEGEGSAAETATATAIEVRAFKTVDTTRTRPRIIS